MDILRLFGEALEKKEYYKAHEILEEIWFPLRHTKTPENLLQKGLINGAISLEHGKRGNLKSAKVCYENFNRYKSQIEHLSYDDKMLYLPVIEQLTILLQGENL